MENIKSILSGLAVPYPSQKIYISLLEEGKATARTLSLRTRITRTSVYDHIRFLRSKDLISERLVEGKSYFEIGDVRRLSILLDDRIEKLDIQKEFLSHNIDKLINKSQSTQPKIRFFEGVDGVQQLLKDILWYDDIILHIYWPYSHMLDFLGEEFLIWFNKRRRAHNIPIRTIWGHSTGKVKGQIFIDDGKDVDRRYLIQKDIPAMGYIIYDKKVAFVSSHKESFGFIIESDEFMSLQKMQFEILWQIAKKKN